VAVLAQKVKSKVGTPDLHQIAELTHDHGIEVWGSVSPAVDKNRVVIRCRRVGGFHRTQKYASPSVHGRSTFTGKLVFLTDVAVLLSLPFVWEIDKLRVVGLSVDALLKTSGTHDPTAHQPVQL